MKKIMFIACSAMLLLSCEKEILDENNSEMYPKGFKTIYGISDPATGGSVLYTVSYTTGATTSLCTASPYCITYNSNAVTHCRAVAQRYADNTLYAVDGTNGSFPGQVFTLAVSAGSVTANFVCSLYVSSPSTLFNVGDIEFDPSNGDLFLTEYGTSKMYRITAAQLTTAASAGSHDMSTSLLSNTNVTGHVSETNGNSVGLAFDLSNNLYICNQNGNTKAQVNKTNGNIVGTACTNANTGSALGVGMCFTGGKFIVRWNKYNAGPPASYTPNTFIYTTCTPGTPGTSGVNDISDLTAKVDVCPGCE